MNDTMEPTLNVPLLRKAVEWVEHEAAKPEIDREWYQGTYVATPRQHARALAWWAVADDAELPEVDEMAARLEPHCGTAYCVAGYVAQLVDERFAGKSYIFAPDDPDADDDGDLHCSALAARELGLSMDQAYDLFYAGNTAADVRRHAEGFAGEAL